MAATGFLSPRIQLFDNDGNPLNGGLVYFYEAGTSALQNTYSDSGLTVPNTNPVVLDSAGRAVVYFSPTPAYKVIVKTSAGVTLTTDDNISPAAVAV